MMDREKKPSERDEKPADDGSELSTGDRHEKRPEGPYKDPADEQEQGKVK